MPLDLDAPFKSFQHRLRTHQLRTPELDNRNRELFGIPSQVVVREAFLADRSLYVDERTWAERRINRQIER